MTYEPPEKLVYKLVKKCEDITKIDEVITSYINKLRECYRKVTEDEIKEEIDKKATEVDELLKKCRYTIQKTRKKIIIELQPIDETYKPTKGKYISHIKTIINKTIQITINKEATKNTKQQTQTLAKLKTTLNKTVS